MEEVQRRKSNIAKSESAIKIMLGYRGVTTNDPDPKDEKMLNKYLFQKIFTIIQIIHKSCMSAVHTILEL